MPWEDRAGHSNHGPSVSSRGLLHVSWGGELVQSATLPKSLVSLSNWPVSTLAQAFINQRKGSDGPYQQGHGASL